MLIAICAVVAYIQLAIGQVVRDRSGPVYNRPMWTYREDGGGAFFAGASWFFRPIMVAQQLTARVLLVALLQSAFTLAFQTAAVVAAWFLAGVIAETPWIRLPLTLVAMILLDFVVGFFRPLFGLLGLLLTTIILLPIGLFGLLFGSGESSKRLGPE